MMTIMIERNMSHQQIQTYTSRHVTEVTVKYVKSNTNIC